MHTLSYNFPALRTLAFQWLVHCSCCLCRVSASIAIPYPPPMMVQSARVDFLFTLFYMQYSDILSSVYRRAGPSQSQIEDQVSRCSGLFVYACAKTPAFLVPIVDCVAS
ncbi:hypothetical protein BDV29DRAFT_70085 [Aspergillus leporis]|uniref:Secreted protein n=1 Tax=Aspergillus leporis TaxID=41062 RepID=A0A5N5WIW3_9EURO|nr:hypothetical protein BDV29DRAFT_70085 [Aspergillus leporis]